MASMVSALPGFLWANVGWIAALFGVYILAVFVYNNFFDGLKRNQRIPPPKYFGTDKDAWWFPFIGHLFFMQRNRHIISLDVFIKVANNASPPYLPPGFRVEVGPNVLVFLHDPDDVRHILNNHYTYEIGDLRREVTADFLGKGIFTTDGEFWKDQRNLAKPSFHQAQIEHMLPIFVRHGKEILERIQRTSAAPKQYIDIQPLFLAYTLDCGGEIFFNHPVGSISNTIPFQKAFDYIQYCVDLRMTNPFWKWTPDARLTESLKICNEFMANVIRDARNDPDLTKRNDLLAHFMLNTKDGKQNLYDDTYIRDMLMNFMIAARDTTAVTLLWLFYELARNHEVQEKLRAEIEEHLGNEPPQSIEEIKRMHYLHTVVNETLRLYPPVPRVLRCCEKDDVIPSGYKIYKGDNVTYSPYVLHRSVVYWGPDALKFDPARWDDERTKKLEAMCFVPFHGGARRCLGFEVAYNEAKTLACMILQKYRVKLNPNHKVEPLSAITMAATYGIQIMFEPIVIE